MKEVNPQNTTTMKTLLMTLGLALAATTMNAQDTKAAPAKAAQADKHACIMADATTWADLGLSAEQVTKVKNIQATCQKEHDAAKAAGTKYTEASKHEGELKAVLTPDQYTKWSQWCDANQAAKPTEGMKK